MSLFQSIYDRTTLFNDSTYRETLDSRYEIQIWPTVARAQGGTDAFIVGMLTSPISISLNANYDTMNIGSVISNIPIVGDIANAVGPVMQYGIAAAGYADISKTGLFSKKFYTSSGYLFLNPQFRVVDWEGTGKPLSTACGMLNFCLPKRVANIDDALRKLKEGLENVVLAISGLSIEDQEGLLNTIQTFGSKGSSFLSNNILSPVLKGTINDPKFIKRALDNTIRDPEALVISSSPTPVYIKIGDYFEHPDMVIEHVGVNFSKQMTKAGPLYVDFDVQLSSRSAAFIDSLGFKSATKRVFRENAQNAFDKNFKGL